MSLARFAVRAVIGGLFIGHGTQKLFGWFGGPGLDGTEKMMDSMEMQPPRHHAVLAGATETGGGALLAAGAATPLAASGLIGMMITAIRKVHLRNGPWMTNGGYEYNLVLIASLVALVETGPGAISVDHALGIERQGAQWALAALALGAAGSVAAVEYGRRRTATQASVASATTYPEDSAADTEAARRPSEQVAER
jgi:putative oxidoreductase